MPASTELDERGAAAAAPGPMVPRLFRVSAKRRDTADTFTLELEPCAGAEPVAFEPGQFTMLCAPGAGEVPISISGQALPGGPLVHTVRAVGLATQAICRAEVGEVLGVRGPFGNAWPVTELDDGDVLVIAGGIGLAPLRPALLALSERSERRGRLLLLYGGRAPDQLLYPHEYHDWSARGIEVLLTVDSAGPEWLGHVGVVPRLLARAGFDPEHAQALLCGPEVMMRFTASALAQSGVPGERVYASMERNMQCGIGHCGHCQLGPTLLCRDGAVYPWSALERWLAIREL